MALVRCSSQAHQPCSGAKSAIEQPLDQHTSCFSVWGQPALQLMPHSEQCRHLIATQHRSFPLLGAAGFYHIFVDSYRRYATKSTDKMVLLVTEADVGRFTQHMCTAMQDPALDLNFAMLKADPR